MKMKICKWGKMKNTAITLPCKLGLTDPPTRKPQIGGFVRTTLTYTPHFFFFFFQFFFPSVRKAHQFDLQTPIL